MNIVDDIKNSFKQGSALTRLIYVNAGVFLLVKVLQALFYLIAKPFPLVFWLALPSNPAELLLRPWTLFTYMFLHEGFMHFLFNILGLYWFGRLLLGYFDERKLISLYLIGGLIGGIFYVLAYNLFPVFMGANSVLLGASASVIAILVAVAAYAPNQEIQLVLIGRVQMKYVALSICITIGNRYLKHKCRGKYCAFGWSFLGMAIYFATGKRKRFKQWVYEIF